MKRLATGISLLGTLLLSACAAHHHPATTTTTTTNGNEVVVTSPDSSNVYASPSPLNTSANPWTNVNPQIQGQMHQATVPVR